MITPSQVILTIFILFVILRTLSAMRAKNPSTHFVTVWLVFWIGVFILIFQQDFVNFVAHSLGISRGVDLIIYISLIITFYMIFRISIKLEELERAITKIVRKISLMKKKT